MTLNLIAKNTLLILIMKNLQVLIFIYKGEYMKLNKNGWGYRMMTLLMSILVIFLLIAIYYIYNYYDKIKGNNYQVVDTRIVEVK